MMVQCCRCPAWQCQADGGSSASIVDEYDGRLSNATSPSPQTTINFRCIPAGAECVTISEAALPTLQVVMYPKAPKRGLQGNPLDAGCGIAQEVVELGNPRCAPQGFRYCYSNMRPAPLESCTKNSTWPPWPMIILEVHMFYCAAR